MKLSIILPVLNEAESLADKLKDLQPLRGACELIVVDGGSQDNSRAIAAVLVDKVLQSPRGRARQMNIGAAAATGDVLLFLHADTQLPAAAHETILQTMANGYQWGRFDVVFDDTRWVFKLIAQMMNWRSRWTGIATGDQAMFVTRKAFAQVGGFPNIVLMEDIAISKHLNKHWGPVCLSAKVTTAARRWQQNGVLRTIFLMWYLRLIYFLGADPAKLAAVYYGRT